MKYKGRRWNQVRNHGGAYFVGGRKSRVAPTAPKTLKQRQKKQERGESQGGQEWDICRGSAAQSSCCSIYTGIAPNNSCLQCLAVDLARSGQGSGSSSTQMSAFIAKAQIGRHVSIAVG